MTKILKIENIKDARELSLHILLDITENEGFANLVLDNYLATSKLNKLERAFATNLVYGVMRHHNTLNWVLEHLVGDKLKKVKPIIKQILLTGLYQIIYMDKVPDSAACNESSKLARKYGHQGVVGFVNGVLRNAARQKDNFPFPKAEEDPVAHVSLRYSHPQWLVKRWISRFGYTATVNLCQHNNKPAALWIRTNSLQTTPKKLIEKMAAAGISTRQSAYAPEGIEVSNIDKVSEIPGYSLGEFVVQDESSMIVAHIVDPKPGAQVIDACSAPGGKTTHLAQLMNNDGHIKAFDIHPHKIGLIKANCDRLGISIVSPQEMDATKIPEILFDWADYLLADVPCSGTGVLGRRADARWRKNPQQLIMLPKLQLEILNRTSQCVKVGGILVYSTCSIEPEENQDVVNTFLINNDNYTLIDLRDVLPFELKEEDLEMAQKGYFQFLPHVHGTDGFFVARLKRIK